MLDKVLIRFSEHQSDAWTIDDAVKGVSIIGGTGSGKTSASGKAIAAQYLKQGWGGVVLCAKSDEADLWRQYCKDAGREDDLIVFGNNAEFENDQLMVFNPIDYELKRYGEGAGETQNITNIFMNIYKMGNRLTNDGDTKEERYWDTALKRCLNRTIELLKLAEEDLTYRNMVRVITTSTKLTEAQFVDELKYIQETDDFSKVEDDSNYCLKCLIKAKSIHFYEGASKSTALSNAFNSIYEYYLLILPEMNPQTKNVVFESFMGLAEPFLSGILDRHFAGATTLFPEWTYEYNKIIVVDFPVKEYLDMGIIGQSVFKLMFQQCIERRNTREYPTPVFLWADEAQYFINSYDQVFLTTARSSRTATVYLSQNIPNYLAAMGHGQDAKPRVDSLMGNLSTKIFHANSDSETNEYASRLIGNAIASLHSQSNAHSYLNASFQKTEGITEHFLPQVQPREFTMLTTGGANYDFQVQAIVFVTGKTWSNATNYTKTIFKQSFNQ